MPQPSDLVITGTGVVSPIGTGSDLFWQSLCQGQSGIRRLEPEQVDHRFWLAGQVLDFDPKDHIQPRKTIKVMSREIQFAVAASMEACRQAGISSETVQPDRLGTVFGSEMIFSEIMELESAVRASSDSGVMHFGEWGKNLSSIYPLWMLKSLPNMAACHLGITLDARGPNNSITTEETSMLVALTEAAMVIERGHADVMIVTAAGGRTCYMRMLQRYEQHYSHWASDAKQACRPFDARRTGKVLGEGAAGLVLESREHAERRGAAPIAILRGWANCFHAPRAPWSGAPQAVTRSAQACLKNANRSASHIDHVNSGGSGSQTLDATQAQGLFDWSPQTPVTALQGSFGDSGPGSGGLELIAAILSLQHKMAPATINFESSGIDCPIPVIHGSARPMQKPCILKQSFTPHGHAVSVLLEQPS